jgi:hypothetical protein
MEMAVEPNVRLAFDDIHELFLCALGVRKGRGQMVISRDESPAS